MAATITEGVLWELQADASQLVAAYRQATAASDRAGASATKAAQASTAAFAGLTKQAEGAGTQIARAGAEIGRASGEIDRSSASSARAGAALARLSAGAAQGYVSLRSLTGVVVNMPVSLGVLSGGLLGVAAAFGVLTLAGAKAQNVLAQVGDQAKQTGIGADTLRGGEVLGARVGLSGEDSRGALANAARQFEQFKRNSGEVKDSLEKVDEKFLSVLDKTRTFGEFYDAVLQKIRALPQEEGLDLAKALLGEDAGQRLFDQIRAGGADMAALAEASAKAGGSIDEAAKHAKEMQDRIDEAAQLANEKMLVAFQNLGDPVANLKLQWFEFVGGIGDAIAKSKELQLVMQGFFNPVGAVKGLFAGNDGAAAQAASGPTIGRLVTLPPDQYSRPENEALLRTPAGVPRARFAARDEKDKGGGGAKVTDAERAEKRFQEITRNLSNQLDLLNAQGEARDRLALKIRIENEQVKIGVGATAEQKDKVAEVVTQLDAAEKAQKRLNNAAKAFNEAYGEIGRTVSDSLKGLIKGDKPKDVLRSGVERLSGGFLDAGLTGTGPFAKFLGLEGKDGAVGGLFGAAADLLGLGGDKTAQTVNVKGSIVNVAGGQGGLSGEAGGGLFSNLFGSNGEGGLFSDITNFFSGFFAEGGTVPAGHWGVAGEKGPELVRGPATVTPFGKLPAATRTESAAPTVINFNVTSPDAPSFARSESQMSALLTRALARGQRNL